MFSAAEIYLPRGGGRAVGKSLTGASQIEYKPYICLNQTMSLCAKVPHWDQSRLLYKQPLESGGGESMKAIMFLATLFFISSASAFDAYQFSCNLSGVAVESIPGTKKAPNSPVVGLNIKVIKSQVPLYLIKANFNGVPKNLFVTDWASASDLSTEGENLLELLSLFFGVDTANLSELRAGIPTDLLDTFAYLELKDKSGVVTKLGFEGTNPSQCK